MARRSRGRMSVAAYGLCRTYGALSVLWPVPGPYGTGLVLCRAYSAALCLRSWPAVCRWLCDFAHGDVLPYAELNRRRWLC